MSHTPLLTTQNLGLTLPGGRTLFRDLSLAVPAGRTGLVGVNGVGKSVLLSVLSGQRTPDRGSVVLNTSVATLPQGRLLGPRFPGETVAHRLGVAQRLESLERIVAGGTDPRDFDRVGADGWDLRERIRARLHGLGLPHLTLDRAVASLSGGERTRVSLAGVLLASPGLLLLDEPTNDLDRESVVALLEALDGWSGGLLVVSHHRELLRRMDRILELTPGGLREYGGDYDHFAERKETEEAAARRELAQARAARKKASARAAEARQRQERRTARGVRSREEGGDPKLVLNARRERSQRTAQRLDRTLDEVAGRARAREAEAREGVEAAVPLSMEVRPSGLPASRDVVAAQGVSWTPVAGSPPVVAEVDLTLRGPERVCIAGPNGSGKSSLLRLLLGELRPTRGRVRRPLPPERVAYLDQRAGLPDGPSVLEVFRDAHPELEQGEARHRLARYLFPGDAVRTPTEALSGGERVRLALACLLGGDRTPWLLVLDEPTNHLDLPSLQAVERAVAEYDGALVVVSHDRDFLEAVGVERTLRLEPRGPSPTG